MTVAENNTRLALKISLIFKSFFALAEITGGALFYFVSQASIIKFIDMLTSNELVEDPKDKIAGYLVASSHSLFASTQHFIAIFLVAQGIVKVALIISLLKHKLWAYPAGIIVFSAFIVYQLYRFSFTHSYWLLILTFIDILVIWLIWSEYSFIKRHSHTSE